MTETIDPKIIILRGKIGKVLRVDFANDEKTFILQGVSDDGIIQGKLVFVQVVLGGAPPRIVNLEREIVLFAADIVGAIEEIKTDHEK